MIVELKHCTYILGEDDTNDMLDHSVRENALKYCLNLVL